MKLTKNDPDNYEYKGYGIGFDARLRFLWRVGSKFAISGVDNNLLVHDDNINKDTLIYVEEPTDRLVDTTITAERNYSVYAINHKKKICSAMQSAVFSVLMA